MTLNELLSVLDETTEINIDINIKNPFGNMYTIYLNVYHGAAYELLHEHNTPDALECEITSIKPYTTGNEDVALDINIKGAVL